MTTLEIVKRKYFKDLAVAVRYASLARGAQPNYGAKLLALAAGLHDIGKSLDQYQLSNRLPLTFRYHEVFSAYIYRNIAWSLARSGADELLLNSASLAIILAHHSMRRIGRALNPEHVASKAVRSLKLPVEEAAGIALKAAEGCGIGLDAELVRKRLAEFSNDKVKKVVDTVKHAVRQAREEYKLALILVSPFLLSDNEAARRTRA